MDGFEKRRNDKKKAIMQTALELFDQYGFDKISVSNIAEKAHASRASIYNFFESKDNLRRVIIKDILNESLEKTQALLENKIDFIDKISEYIHIRTWYYGKYSLQFFFDAIEGDPELRQCFDDFTIRHKQLLMKFIDEGKRSGVFSSYISNTAIEIYIDTFQLYYTHNIQKKEIRNALEGNAKLAREVHQLFLNGLMHQGQSEDA